MSDRLLDEVAVREWGDPAEEGILLWPGLSSTGAYFASLAEALPGRAVAVDPPGFGRSVALHPASGGAPTRWEAWNRFAEASALIELHVADEWSHNRIWQDPETFSALVADWLRLHL